MANQEPLLESKQLIVGEYDPVPTPIISTVRFRLLSIFVVTFDSTKGNTLEWQYPKDCDLQNVEYKAIASGMHNVESDYVKFTHHDHYGVSVFNQLHDGEAPRGALMRSVGVISTTHEPLSAFLGSLDEFVRQINKTQTICTEDLENFFNTHQTSPPPKLLTGPFHPERSPHSMFLKTLGPSSILLWRALLLRLRILFYSPVPLGNNCDKVDCCVDMSCSLPNASKKDPPSRLYYVNLDDVHTIVARSSFYVACTTEKIFEARQTLWDVYVNVDKLVISSKYSSNFTLSDRDVELYRGVVAKVEAASLEDKATCFRTCFHNLTTQLFDVLQYGPTIIGPQDMARMNLSDKDQAFLTSLCNIYSLERTMKQPKLCSCCCWG